MSENDPNEKDQSSSQEFQRTARSIGRQPTSLPNMGGSPLERPIARPTIGGDVDKEFEIGLVTRLAMMETDFRLAKVMFVDQAEVHVVGFLRNEWKSPTPRTVRMLRFWAKALDLIPMPNHGTYMMIGAAVPTAIATIRGFMWIAAEDEGQYIEHFSNDPRVH